MEARKENKSIEDLCRKIAVAIYSHHRVFDESGTEVAASTPRGVVLKAAATIEELAVRMLTETGKTLRVISRLSGLDNGVVEADLTLMIEGLDGADAYRRAYTEDRTGEYDDGEHYSTMFAVFRGNRPQNKDCIVSCIIEHTTGRIFYSNLSTTRILDYEGNYIGTTLCVENRDLPVFCEYDHPDVGGVLRNFVLEPFTKMSRTRIVRAGSFSRGIVNVITGAGKGVVTTTVDNNFLLMMAYALVVQAGGVAFSMGGPPLNNETAYDDPALPILYVLASDRVSASTIEWVLSENWK